MTLLDGKALMIEDKLGHNILEMQHKIQIQSLFGIPYERIHYDHNLDCENH